MHDGRTKENTEITIMRRVFENGSGSKSGHCIPANITVMVTGGRCVRVRTRPSVCSLSLAIATPLCYSDRPKLPENHLQRHDLNTYLCSFF